MRDERMSYPRRDFLDILRRALTAFPIACFTLTVGTNLAYLQTSNLLWLHFSEWLLLFGLAAGLVAGIVALLQLAFSRTKPSWGYLVCGALVLILAALNNFIHTADGWTAVMPFGITVSIATVVLMLLTGWFGRIRYV